MPFKLIIKLWIFTNIIPVHVSDNVGLEVIVNGQLQLNCEGSVSAWDFLSNGTTATPIIQRTGGNTSCTYSCAESFVGGDGICRNGISMDCQNGRSIEISSVRMEDAGRYTCKKDTPEMSATSEVTVVGTAPLLRFYRKYLDKSLAVLDGNSVFPNVNVYIQCSVQYSGFVGPSLKLMQRFSDGTEIPLVPPSPKISKKYALQQQFTIEYDYVTSEIEHELEFTCQLLGLPNVSGTKRFQVYYGPQFADTKQDINSHLVNGAVALDCTAASYPAPTYTWMGPNSNPVMYADSPIYTAEEPGEYMCEVQNSKLNKRASKRFHVQGMPPDSMPPPESKNLYNQFMAGVAVTISVIGGIVIVGAIIAVIIRRRKARRPQQPRRQSHPNPITALPGVGVINEAYEMNDDVPQWEAPPSYEEATKDDIEAAANNSGGPS